MCSESFLSEGHIWRDTSLFDIKESDYSLEVSIWTGTLSIAGEH